MKEILPIILAGAMNAQPIEDVKVPMTPEIMQSINNFIVSSVMVCEKQKVSEKDCEKRIEKEIKDVRTKANEVCKDYPKEVIPCLQY
jgi:S-adenosylmethionine synthetase